MGADTIASFNHVSGTCNDGSRGALKKAHYPASQLPNTADEAVTVSSATLGTATGGASDTILANPAAAASASVSAAFSVADGLATTAAELAYANAYYGVGGDMLVVDSKPDAIRGSDPIEMDITYTGPSGSRSVEEVTKGSKESAVCSNRGVCDYETGTCVCAEGFMKEACSEQSVLV